MLDEAYPFPDSRNSPMIDSPALNTFLDDLIAQKHGEDLSTVGRDQIKSELSPRLEKWLALKAIEELPELKNLAQGTTEPSAVLKLVEEKIPDTTVFFTKALADFWNAYLT